VQPCQLGVTSEAMPSNGFLVMDYRGDGCRDDCCEPQQAHVHELPHKSLARVLGNNKLKARATGAQERCKTESA